MSKKVIFVAYFLSFFLLFNNKALANIENEALRVVKSSISDVLDDLGKNNEIYKDNYAKYEVMINTKIVPYFDIKAMARLVLGKSWKSATDKQRDSFVHEFKRLAMRTYSSSLLGYIGAKVEYGEPSKIKRNRTKINAIVTSTSGKTIDIKASMGYRNNKWKTYDVSMNGLSVITSYRSSFGEEISRKGLEAVINDIKVLNDKATFKKE